MFELAMSELLGALIQLCLFTLIPWLWWLNIGRTNSRFTSWLGLKKMTRRKHLGKLLILTLVVVIGYSALTFLCVHFVSDHITTAGSQFAGLGLQAVPAACFYAYIRTGLSEEIFFRGFLLKCLTNQLGFQKANLVQALIFGFMHGIPFGLATQQLLVSVLMTLLPGAFGWYQGWLNEKGCGGSILPSWLLHGTMNFVVTCLSL